jgi:hypothetical protein
MKKEKIGEKVGEKRESPEWVGESNEKEFVGRITTAIVISLLLLVLFIVLGLPA